MLAKLSARALALAAVGLALGGPAAAYDPARQLNGQSYVVDVNIEVDPVVSMWSNEDEITLTMNGFDGNNAAWHDSSLSVINNVDARVDALVAGTLPPPIVPGGGIYFHIFNYTPSDVPALFQANGYGNVDARTWTFGTLGVSQTLVASTGVNTSILNVPITYAATAPGEIPLPATYDLTVTYTIVENP